MKHRDFIKELKSIQHSISVKFAELVTYKWDSDFKLKYIDDFEKSKPDILITKEKLELLTRAELLEMNFSLWDEESKLMLIPIYYKPFLDPEMEVIDIMGGVGKVKDMNNDHRYGFLAYGFVYKL